MLSNIVRSLINCSIFNGEYGQKALNNSRNHDDFYLIYVPNDVLTGSENYLSFPQYSEILLGNNKSEQFKQLGKIKLVSDSSKLKICRYFLPYNPNRVEKAREMRKKPTPAEHKIWYEYLRSSKLRVL
jgi:hypothetical protein